MLKATTKRVLTMMLIGFGICGLFTGCSDDDDDGGLDNGCPEWCAWNEECDPTDFPGMSECIADCDNYLSEMAVECTAGCDEATTDIYLCRAQLECTEDPFTACADEFDYYENLCCSGGICCDETF